MQLLIMSDTHGDADIIQTVKNYYPNVDKVIHCGDSELSYEHPYLQGVERVRGNCDYFEDQFPDDITFDIGKDRVYIAHGHHFKVKTTLIPLSYRVEEVGATICCFGHSHLLGAEKIGDTLFLNPGSLKKPRGRKEKSFILLEITADSYIVKCYSSENNLLDEFVFPKGN